jgi:NADH-quinone oxidoreductase subunit E
VNYRYEYRVDGPALENLVDDLRSGARTDVPPHGTLARVRQHIPDGSAAGIEPPEVAGTPAWFASRQPAEERS